MRCLGKVALKNIKDPGEIYEVSSQAMMNHSDLEFEFKDLLTLLIINEDGCIPRQVDVDLIRNHYHYAALCQWITTIQQLSATGFI